MLGLYEAIHFQLTPAYFEKFTDDELHRLVASQPLNLVERDCDERIRRERMRRTEV